MAKMTQDHQRQMNALRNGSWRTMPEYVYPFNSTPSTINTGTTPSVGTGEDVCWMCKGSGINFSVTCASCKGTGESMSKRIRDGMRLPTPSITTPASSITSPSIGINSDVCTYCNGTRKSYGTNCAMCNGTGRNPLAITNSSFTPTMSSTVTPAMNLQPGILPGATDVMGTPTACTYCKGTGTMYGMSCGMCSGSGRNILAMQ